ncbi:MAG: peptidylprolyl isomerase [Ghiorsea sp.]|nr:peptidylprolyl isomerase [Ghiorsea sp.]
MSEKTETAQAIAANKAVEIHYTLTNKDGETVDSSFGQTPLAYIQGTESLVPGLEKHLEGKEVGANITVSITPEEGYGERNEDLMQAVPLDVFQFDGEIEVGMRFEAETGNGIDLVTVTEVDDNTVTVDGNHPLAGQTLNFVVQVMSIRDATKEELEHGHIHGEGGCGH